MQQPEWTPETEHQYELAICRLRQVEARSHRHRRREDHDMNWHWTMERLNSLDARYWSDANKLLKAAGVARFRDRESIIKQALKTKVAVTV